MIKINDILEEVNTAIKTHYFKDITTYKVVDLVKRNDIEGEENINPAIYIGDGEYNFIQDDTKGLIVYHRIDGEVENEEDTEKGFGRNSLITETYPIKTVFYGQQGLIEKDAEDINLYLAKEFKKLIPRKLNISGESRTSITVASINYDKEAIQDDEGLKIVPESVLFTLELEIKIVSLEACNILKCN